MGRYSPLRARTTPLRSRYSAKPFPWWNRVRLAGTSTKGRA